MALENKDRLNAEILTKIEELILAYNMNNNDEQIRLLTEQIIDTSNLYVCAYDAENVGFFYKTDYDYCDGKLQENSDGDISVYREFAGNRIGMWVWQFPTQDLEINEWLIPGTYFNVETNTHITCAIHYDAMRAIRNQKEYTPKMITINKTTNSEMQEVLEFGYDFYREKNIISQNKSKIKEKGSE